MARMTTPAEDTLTALIHLLDREGYDAVTADQLARLHGDEFAVLLEDADVATAAGVALQRSTPAFARARSAGASR